MRQICFVLCLTSAVILAACKRDERQTAPPAASVTAAGTVASSAPPKGRNWPMPTGPMLAISAGQGVGPIRIGATVATIQRHMGLPCDVKTPALCRYIGRAVEFHLKNGAAERIAVHRAGRAAGKDSAGTEREYGFFNGAIPPDLRFGMVPTAIQEHLGPPERVEQVDAVPPNNTAERHYYRGLTIEYDRHANGNLIMSGAIIEKPTAAPAASASASAAK